MKVASQLTLGNVRNWRGIVAQASAGLPPVYVMMFVVMGMAKGGLPIAMGYDTAVLIYIMMASVALVATVILLGIGRLLLGRWHRELIVMNATIYSLVLIEGVTLEFVAGNMRDCGELIC
jgi:hypothetical protein